MAGAQATLWHLADVREVSVGSWLQAVAQSITLSGLGFKGSLHSPEGLKAGDKDKREP